jgi:20S proteasome subunit beta 1
VEHGEPPRVEVAANLFRQLIYTNKDALSAGIIVGGWDKYEGGSVWTVPLGGSLHKQPYSIGGWHSLRRWNEGFGVLILDALVTGPHLK